jgi:hypothetical protein
MKVNQTANLVLLLISLAAFIIIPSCEKKEDPPPQECKTCTAKNRIDATLIKEEQACNAEQEQQFRSRYNPEQVTVTCR